MDNKNKQKIAELLKLIEGYEDMIAQAQLELRKYSVSDVLKAYEEGRITDNEKNNLLEHRKSLLLIVEEVPSMLDDTRKELSEATKAALSSKPKKLGGWHIVITYLLVPAVLLISVIGLIIQCVYWQSVSVMWHIPFIISLLTMIFVASVTFISLIQRNKQAYYLVHAFFSCAIYLYMTNYIPNLMSPENILSVIPIEPITFALLFIAVHKYYRERKSEFDNPRIGSLLSNINEMLPGVIYFNFSIMCSILYGVSIYYMFQDSVGYGLFGVFVPVISQFVYLYDVGFASSYAFNLYFAALTFCFAFCISGIMEIENKQ